MVFYFDVRVFLFLFWTFVTRREDLELMERVVVALAPWVTERRPFVHLLLLTPTAIQISKSA